MARNCVVLVVLVVSIVSVMVVFSFPPISQDLNYHLFADTRYLLFTPNSLNVLSNIPFFLVGLYGLWTVLVSKAIKVHPQLKIAFITFFVGVALVSVGSGYYHLAPSNESLVWDRLPMTIAFMALFSIALGEFVTLRCFKLFFFLLVLLGLLSIVYWHVTESQGVGDLRPYILVQFLPIFIIPLFILLGRSNSCGVAGYWLLMVCYLSAKLFEFYDEPIYKVFGVSGHSLKHLAAALGVFLFSRSYCEKN